LTFLGAAGSGELEAAKHPADTKNLGPEVYQAYQHLTTGSQWQWSTPPIAVQYTADGTEELKPSARDLAEWASLSPPVVLLGVTDYVGIHLKPFLASISNGVSSAEIQAKAAVTKCKNTRLVLAGYSQGAMVMHRMLLDWQATNSPLLSKVAAVLLIADGDRVPGTGADQEGTSTADASGIASYMTSTFHLSVGAPDQDIPAAVAGQTVNVCDTRDIICDANLVNLSHFNGGAKTHTTHYRTSPTGYPQVMTTAEQVLTARLRHQLPFITTTAPPPGTVRQAYSTQLTTADHRTGSWAITAGALPSGLHLSGFTISGTPTKAGRANFTLKFTDTFGQSATAAASIKVALAVPASCPNAAVLTATLPAAQQSTADLVNIKCASGWATADYQIDGNQLPGVWHVTGGQWQMVNRSDACNAADFPASLRDVCFVS
jgi:hypothetical protein